MKVMEQTEIRGRKVDGHFLAHIVHGLFIKIVTFLKDNPNTA